MNYMLKRWLSRILVFTLVAANFGTLGFSVVQAEEGVITVSEAIANNNGTATVEGYVVAHTTGTNSYDFEAPFSNDYNLALADSISETDAVKILPVQITSSFRDQFGLQTNPNLIGKKLHITGNLEAYYAVPGLKSPSSFEVVDGDTDPTPDPSPGELISIAEARQKTVGEDVYVTGVITADNSAIGGGNLSTFIQDDTAGINIFSFSIDGFPDLKEGDLVKLRGQIAEYKGLKEIMLEEMVVLEQNQALPPVQETTIADLGEDNEGSLVQITAYLSHVPSSPAGGGYNLSLLDENYNGTTLRVMETTNINVATLEVGKWYDITAIVGQYDSYQLIPRKAADIVMAQEQPEAPQPAEYYRSTIASVVDGDTVHLESQVLGTTKVRMLSIDTPETNYNGESQGEHAEAATAKLVELLPVGTEVVIEVGEDPLDGYGRLLAHVWTVDTAGDPEMDINKEMVRLGMAVPYFIWPNVEHFEGYSQAAEEAITNGRGMWDPNNPIEELPYEFRFNKRGGPDKYVADYFTRRYVTPEEWEEVPVQNRLFFFTEQEAIDAGYTFDGEESNTIKIQLLSLNDLHGKIDQEYNEEIGEDGTETTVGRMDYVATYLKEREAMNPNTLIVHAGDMVGGSSPVSALLQDEPTVEIMEAIGFDVGTVGNHEFDEGTAEMLRLTYGGDHPNGTENYDGINFPMIVANVVYKASGEPVLPPYFIAEIAGTQIGFVGVATTNTPNMVIPAGIADIEFVDEATAVNSAVTELKEQGVKAIVVLAHMSASQDGTAITDDAADLANEVDDEVDIIFAAHNHQIVDGIVDNKLIVQAWEYGKAFTDVDIEIDPSTQDIVTKSAEIVYIEQAGVTPDPEVANILETYTNRIAPILNEVIGEAALAMEGGYSIKGPIGDNALGNLIADGMRVAMDSDFALMNGGGIRDNVDAGEITWGELYNIQPFNNVLTKLEIQGADLETIINAQISQQYGPDYSISGFRYTWDGETSKVVNIYLPDGTLIDATATYTLTVNNFMATSTGRKYAPIGQLGQNSVTGPEDLEATVDFVRSFEGPIHYEAEGRISEVEPDGVAPVTTLSKPTATFPDGSYLGSVTLELSAMDEGMGVEKIEYSLDSGNTWIVYDEPITIDTAGETSIQYHAIDKAGNEEAIKTDVVTVKAADFQNLEEFVQSADFANQGLRNSIMAHIKKSEYHFEKAEEERQKGKEQQGDHFEQLGYESLQRVRNRVDSFSDEQLSPEDKQDIITILDYIITNRTISIK